MGMIVWQGISRLDNVTPIVVLATFGNGKKASANVKTGSMVQVFILRADVAPHDALRQGLDTAICGVCPHRGKASGGTGACYVTVWQGPRATWQSWKNGNAKPFDINAFRGRKVRFGAYGDPAAVPVTVWHELAGAAAAVTGYTHQWRTAPAEFAQWCMASTDSVEERRQARAIGYRTFHVRAIGTAKGHGEIVCPASTEAGKRVQCADCLQCGGHSAGRRADITITAHGAAARSFAPLPLTVA